LHVVPMKTGETPQGRNSECSRPRCRPYAFLNSLGVRLVHRRNERLNAAGSEY
jgi:hypothetical protein